MAKNTTEKMSPVWVIAKIIRVITVPPVMALAAFTAFLFCDGFYKNVWEFIAAAGFIALFPILAYPLSAVLPMDPWKNYQPEGNQK